MASDDGEDENSRMRKINGPLSDLWKKRHQILPHNANGSNAMLQIESADFEHGPWIEMCQFMDLDAKEGRINGGIDLSHLPINTEQILTGFQSSGTLDQDLLLLIQSRKYVDEEIDPLGSIDGYFHRDVVSAIGASLVKGTGIILRKVTVFMPVERGQQYLNICRGNIVQVFPATAGHEQDLDTFHATTEIVQVFEDSSIATTTAADLAIMTQRQVIQRSSKAPAPLPSGGGKTKKLKGKWAWKSFVPRKKVAKESPLSSSDKESPAPVVQAPKAPVWKPRKPPVQAPPIEAPPRTTQYESGFEISDDDVPSSKPTSRSITFTQTNTIELLEEALNDEW
ncbi:hypothetical protein THRCLA_20526 [Thraustotheca clavata]|uniref:Homologous recombination OB-fold protein OB-fold domain-containing protein n=1 Tax=Thraustotheca clavata TaxID=74557 RepID=A0A1W0A6H8_9STRA|nr:hypothetical protein THRCLA_20526 [Thraustotheca clavata]